MLLSISEILGKYSDLKTKIEKIEWLRKNDSYALRMVLIGAFDPNVVFDLPKDDPPYKPTPYLDQESALYKEARRFYLFTKDGNPNLTSEKRLNIFIQLLETVTPSDAILLLHMKDKKLPYNGLTVKNINEAFPGLIPVVETATQKKKETSSTSATVTEIDA